jgi:NADPH-dependent curcumin reductase CurA
MKNEQWILSKRPVGVPNLETDITLQQVETRNLNLGEILIETQYLSLDPYMRGRMNAGPSYATPVDIGGVMEGEVIGKIIESKSKLYKKGDFINTRLGWQKYGIVNEKTQINKIDFPSGLPITYSLGVLGMPGRTAYLGFTEVCKPKPGETIVISAASGAVGSIVGQIAKLMGCRVIGIVGNDSKVKYCKETLNFESFPTIPITRQPISFAICPTIEPTAPDAAEITMVSPGLGLHTSVKPKYAVLPGIPSTPKEYVIGRPEGKSILLI